jgi:hypothetical protein
MNGDAHNGSFWSNAVAVLSVTATIGLLYLPLILR